MGSSGRRRCLRGTGRIRSDHCGVYFFASFHAIERPGASKRFLVILMYRHEYFLSLTAGLESYGLELLEGRRRDLRRRHET